MAEKDNDSDIDSEASTSIEDFEMENSEDLIIFDNTKQTSISVENSDFDNFFEEDKEKEYKLEEPTINKEVEKDEDSLLQSNSFGMMGKKGIKRKREAESLSEDCSSFINTEKDIEKYTHTDKNKNIKKKKKDKSKVISETQDKFISHVDIPYFVCFHFKCKKNDFDKNIAFFLESNEGLKEKYFVD
jgi:hypothetical protein